MEVIARGGLPDSDGGVSGYTNLFSMRNLMTGVPVQLLTATCYLVPFGREANGGDALAVTPQDHFRFIG